MEKENIIILLLRLRISKVVLKIISLTGLVIITKVPLRHTKRLGPKVCAEVLLNRRKIDESNWKLLLNLYPDKVRINLN